MDYVEIPVKKGKDLENVGRGGRPKKPDTRQSSAGSNHRRGRPHKVPDSDARQSSPRENSIGDR